MKSHWAIRRLALILLEELDSGYLEVVKVPIEGGYIRVAVSVNAQWYRAFCKQYLWSRSKRFPKPRTIIRRQHTRAALKRIAKGNCAGVYAERLLEFMHSLPIPKRKAKLKLVSLEPF